MPVTAMGNLDSMVDLLRHRAAEQADDRAYVFVSERGDEEAVLTFAGLYRRACSVAAQLTERGERGERAILLFPAGLDFIVAFFGCLVAGVVPVPMMVPRRASSRDASAAIVADCSPRFAMTSRALATTRTDVLERFQASGVEWVIPRRRPGVPSAPTSRSCNILRVRRRPPKASSSATAICSRTSK